MNLHAAWCGTVVYEEALRWQRLLVDRRAGGDGEDVVLTVEHDRVYTAGRRADVAHNVLGTRDIRVVPTDRGGDVTYHGPGQLVAYPIVRLAHPKAVREHVDALVEACVRAAADWGIRAAADPRRPGVWVGDEKLAAIGVRVDRGVTLHGLAFNVTTDLADFGGLVPCGLPDAGVCSLESLGVTATVADVEARLVAHLGDVLGREIVRSSPAELGLSVNTSSGIT